MVITYLRTLLANLLCWNLLFLCKEDVVFDKLCTWLPRFLQFSERPWFEGSIALNKMIAASACAGISFTAFLMQIFFFRGAFAGRTGRDHRQVRTWPQCKAAKDAENATARGR
jgi:hypothetical protein